MRVLVVGGSGDVGTLVIPFLAQHHQLRVFDLRPPAHEGCEYVKGDVTSPDDLARAAEGMEVLLFMAMGAKDFDSMAGITTQFDVNIKGVYLALHAAHLAGIPHAVYTSTLSIYEDLGAYYIPNEEMAPNSYHVYGFTKRIGEEVCQNAVKEWGMTVNALRLCHPMTDERWLEIYDPDKANCSTAASDLSRAVHAAIEHRDGFQAFMITGDYQEKMLSMDKAKRVLNWEPQSRPAPKST